MKKKKQKPIQRKFSSKYKLSTFVEQHTYKERVKTGDILLSLSHEQIRQAKKKSKSERKTKIQTKTKTIPKVKHINTNPWSRRNVYVEKRSRKRTTND